MMQARNHMPAGYLKAEQQAQQCFMPLLLVRRHAQVLMSNADVELKQCLGQHDQDSVTSSMKPKADSDLVDARKYECLTNYKKSLKAMIPKISSIYDGYIKNFGTDGKLI